MIDHDTLMVIKDITPCHADVLLRLCSDVPPSCVSNAGVRRLLLAGFLSIALLARPLGVPSSPEFASVDTFASVILSRVSRSRFSRFAYIVTIHPFRTLTSEITHSHSSSIFVCRFVVVSNASTFLFESCSSSSNRFFSTCHCKNFPV